MRAPLFALTAFALLVFPACAEEDCALHRIVALDMLPSPAGVVVPATIGDHPLRMVVDTGGYITAFTEKTARDLKLSQAVYPASGITLYGGTVLRRYVTLSDFRLGQLKTRSLEYPLLPDGFLPSDTDGLLAPDFLANFDVDFDFANGKLTLFAPHNCEGHVAWWTTRDKLSVIPIKREEDQVHISMHVTLDGEDVKALIDTGGGRTVMSLENAQDLFHIKDGDPRLSDAPGVNNIQGAKRFHFNKLLFGDVEVTNPEIILIPDRASGMGRMRMPKMILGIGILRQLHLYIAYKEKNLYLTAASEHR